MSFEMTLQDYYRSAGSSASNRFICYCYAGRLTPVQNIHGKQVVAPRGAEVCPGANADIATASLRGSQELTLEPGVYMGPLWQAPNICGAEMSSGL